jgi:phytoene dehydrogenase-like protein
VVGSGPNGLAAAVTLARAGLTVEVLEGADTPGGGCRTQELTVPGFHHDVCSAVHPLLTRSPFFASLDLAALGAELLTPEVAFAHPLDGGRAAVVGGSVAETAALLGPDEHRYRRLLGPLVEAAAHTVPAFLRPLRSVPDHPLAAARFGLLGVLPVRVLADRFSTEEARAILAGTAAHSMLPLGSPMTAAYALILTMLAHSPGWPVVAGGSARIADALVTELRSSGGELTTGRWVRSLDDVGPVGRVLLDVTPRQLLSMAGDRLPGRYRRQLARYRYGPGVCKVDWALDGPVPWTASACRRTATVHLGGSFAEVARSEAEVAAGRHPERPFCIVAQPAVVDPGRAPAGRATLWAYCHTPPGSEVDMTERIEAQIERFAPGFRDLVIARNTRTAADIERYDPNCVGGDVNGGLATLRQTLFRPTVAWNPYLTPLPGVYLCSAATPPGGGVHGMCGANAASVALARRA